MSMSRVYRLLRLITILQGSRLYTAGELAEELEVSRRTIFRDLNMLEMAHIPYYFDADRKGYRISRHFFLPPINLTLAEALAVLILARRTRGRGQLPLLAASAQAAVKIESALPAAIRQDLGSIVDKLSVQLGPVARHEGLDDLFQEFADAVARRKVCRIVYISFYEKKQITCTIHPLRMLFLGRAWYVIAYSGKHRENRTFKLGRIRKLTVTDQTFPGPAEIDLEDYFGHAWSMIPEGKLHDVHLHFEPKVAGNVAEVQWHHSQRVEWNDDGSIEYFAHVDGLGEITWWILGYGNQVEVVSPPPLRRSVADVAGQVLRKYRQEGRKS